MSKPFHELVSLLLDAEESLANKDFDPAALVGDLRDKVDALKAVKDGLEGYINFLTLRSRPLLKAKRAAKKNLERLKDYMTNTMLLHNFDNIPGQVWRLQMDNNAESIIWSKPLPDAADKIAHFEFVKVNIDYSWDKVKVLEHLKSGQEFPFAKLTRTKHCQFYLNKVGGRRKSKTTIDGEVKNGDIPPDPTV